MCALPPRVLFALQASTVASGDISDEVEDADDHPPDGNRAPAKTAKAGRHNTTDKKGGKRTAAQDSETTEGHRASAVSRSLRAVARRRTHDHHAPIRATAHTAL